MWGKIKLRRADTLFSLYLRKRRGYRCEFDNAFFREGRGLTVSHFWSRGKESVRFDEENCDILCVRDHAFFESHKTEYTAWKKERMGEKAFNLLMVRAHTTGKRDDKLQIMLWKKLMKEQNSEMHDL